jgi:endoglucanase
VELSPTPGSFTTAQLVTLTDSTPDSVIHYTTNGTTPTASSPVYSAPLTVSATTTIKALASASGYSASLIVIGTYTISTSAPVTPVTASVTLSPEPGSFTSAQSVMLNDSTPGAVIHYTTDGTMPTTNSPVYSEPLSVSATTTIQALAAAPGYTSSAMAGGTYTISTSTVTVTAPSKSSGGGGALGLWELALLAGVFLGKARVRRSEAR